MENDQEEEEEERLRKEELARSNENIKIQVHRFDVKCCYTQSEV